MSTEGRQEDMRTIYCTTRKAAIVQNRRTRKEFLWIVPILIAGPFVLRALSSRDEAIEKPVFVATCFMAVFFLFCILWQRRKLIKTSDSLPRPVQLGIDKEKVIIEDGAMKVTMRFDEIAQVLDIEGCLVLVKKGVVLITLPKDQLLEDELRLLEAVKSRL